MNKQKDGGPLLRIADLHKSFGPLEVLSGISLDVVRGEKVSIIGPSGSGKTTLLRCINYLEKPTSGHIYIDGNLVGEKKINGRFVHLSDRELYDYLYHDGLREEAVLFPENPSYAYMIDLTGSGSDEDNQIYLKYYADEEHRRQWAHDWPDDMLPEHEDPPFDRDQFLPRSPLA